MGYDVHITRAVLWMRNGEQHIPLGSWLSKVEEDGELTPDSTHGPYSARWNQRGSTEVAWFDWQDGNIYTTSPTRAAVAKMLALAKHFTARVQGNDGEVYEHANDWRAPRH